MKYALCLLELPDTRQQCHQDPAMVAAGKAYDEALAASGVFVAGAGLEPPHASTTVSIRNGKREVQDGPFVETKEFLGGFYIIDVPDLDHALDWAARHPAAPYTAIEVRPVVCFVPPPR